MQSFASDHRYAQTNHVYGSLRKIRAQGPMYSDFLCVSMVARKRLHRFVVVKSVTS